MSRQVQIYPAPDSPALGEAIAAFCKAEFNKMKIMELTLEEKVFSWLY